MTKDEIKALISAKIAGQGSAIDAASVLPAILNGIIDAIPDPYVLPAATKNKRGGVTIGNGLRVNDGPLETSLVAPRTDENSGLLSVPFASFQDKPIAEAVELFNMTLEQFFEIPNQLFLQVGGYLVTRTYLRIDGDNFQVQFGAAIEYSGVGVFISYLANENTVTYYSFEL